MLYTFWHRPPTDATREAALRLQRHFRVRCLHLACEVWTQCGGQKRDQSSVARQRLAAKLQWIVRPTASTRETDWLAIADQWLTGFEGYRPMFKVTHPQPTPKGT